METLLTDLYVTALRDMQFSITGHKDIEELTNTFFDKLSDSTFFRHGNIPFTFLIGGVLKVRDISSWELRPFTTFYCNIFQDCEKEEVLSFYFFLMDGKGESTSNILARLFGTDIDFKVSVTKNAEADVSFEKADAIFEVKIPRKVFNQKFAPVTEASLFKKRFRENYFHIFDSIDGHLITEKVPVQNRQNVIHVNESVFENTEITDRYRQLYESIFDLAEINNVREELITELNYQYQKNTNLFIKNDDTQHWLDELVTRSIALSFLCVYFQCRIEYMMSVGNVEQSKQGNKLYRNIGGLIVGYSNAYDLKPVDRVILNLVSDRLTAVVSADYVHTTGEISEVIKDWSEKHRIEYEKLMGNGTEWNTIKSEIDSKSTELWLTFQKEIQKIEEKLKNNNSNYIPSTPKPFNNSTNNITLTDFLIGRRIIMACIQLTGNIEQGERYAIRLIRKESHDYSLRASNINPFRDFFGFEYKGYKGKNYPPLPEERQWLDSI